MLKIRFQRVGKKHDPSYRIVLIDSRKAPQSGAFLEILGFYNPKTKERLFKKERIEHWISKGAQLSGVVNNLLVREKIIRGKKVNVSPPKKAKKKEKEEVKE